MTNGIKILIADDHAIFRHGLKDILVKHFPGVTIGEAETGDGALEQVRKANWHVAVLDVTMPGRNGVDVLREIKQIRPALPILMLSMHPEEQYAVCVLQAGADGYITKIKAPLEIVAALQKVLAGDRYISPTLAEYLRTRPASGMKMSPTERLSERELQVLGLTLSGRSLKEIADALSISIQTVSTHRTRILKKLRLRNTAELIRYALENNLAE